MIRKTIMGVTAAAMLAVTPTASAGYWTGHAEVIRTIIENWILNHTKGMEGAKADTERTAGAAPALNTSRPATSTNVNRSSR